MKHYSRLEINRIKFLRMTMKPAEIAIIVNRSIGAIHQILHREKKKGAVFPKLKHGRLKYDCKKAQEWRDMLRNGMNYRDIKRIQGISPVTISRVLSAEARNELRW